MSSAIEKIETDIKLVPKEGTELRDLARLTSAIVKKAREIQKKS